MSNGDDTPDTGARAAGRWIDRGPWVGVAAGLVLIVVVVALVAPAISRNGEFTYPVDDAYIHFAMGENLADHGVLGINAGEFSSTSSSPIWPLLVAGSIKVAGPLIGVPLVLAVLSALALLVGLDAWALRRGFPLGQRAMFMASLLLIVPVTVLTLTGMEHVLQAGASFLLLWLAVAAATRPDSSRLTMLGLAVASMFCVSTRFEGLFVVAASIVILMWTRRWVAALAVAVGGALPALVVALVNIGQGWPPLPASVAAKTTADSSGISRYLPEPDLYQWLRTPRLLAVFLLTLIVLVVGRRAMQAQWPARNTLFSAGVLAIGVLHLLFAKTGFFYRYEGYLLVLGLGATALGLHTLAAAGKLRSTSLVFRVGIVALLALAAVDGARIHTKAVAGMDEIHQQQMQMARFAATACDGCRVAVNDIGAVAVYGDGSVMDVFGLANRAVLEQKLDRTYDTEAVGRIARDEGVALAMVYPPAEFSMIPGIPDGWERLGRWRIPSNQVVGQPMVDFYSVDPERTAELQRAWDAFDPDGAEKEP